MSEKQENIIVNKKSTKPFLIMIIVGGSLLFISIILYIISSVFGFLVGIDAFNIVTKIIDVGSQNGWDGVFNYLKEFNLNSSQIGQIIALFVLNICGTFFLIPGIGLLGAGIPLFIVRKNKNKVNN